MRALIFAGIGIVTLWLQLTVAPLLSIAGYKPNLALLTVVVMGLRWREPWLFLYAAGCGLALDSFSHGALGVYAISLFAASFGARLIGFSMYGNSLLLGAVAVFGVSLGEGLVSVTIFQWLNEAVPWWRWMFTLVLPAALVNALWSPFIFFALARLERFARPSEA